jgi:hypothetical protein
MMLSNVIKKILKETYDKKILKESLSVNDISSKSNLKTGNMKNDKYFVLHHTAGRGTAGLVVNVLNNRGLGIQWVIDREGKIYRTLPSGRIGYHVVPNKSSAPSDLKNSTAQGVEIIAKNESDVLINQCKSALYIVKSLGYPLSNIYGHGELQSNKASNEGLACKAYFKKYWNTNFNDLPLEDQDIIKSIPELGKLKKVAPAETTEYLTYAFKSGELYNLTNVNTGDVFEMNFKGNDNKKIFGFRRKSDKKVYLFKFDGAPNRVKYLEMNWNTYTDTEKRKNAINGSWGNITKKGASGGLIN